ncbi:MAG: aspartyl protease family protein [Armatimonadetes bacterium]|nr:aspartyl protease family protein [Armatimonadota bacterium]
MGRITVDIKVENAGDFLQASQEQIPMTSVRRLEARALVDTGATLLCLPRSQIESLGLLKIDSRRVTTANGTAERGIYSAARLTVLGRTCTLDVIELLEDTPPLLGYIPLENLDLVVDPTTESLRGAHGEEIVLDLY